MAAFGAWDYTILAIVLLISAAIGIYYRLSGGKQKTAKEFLLADRSMSILPVAFSLMASFMSAVTLLGVSMENYQYGTQFVMINAAYVLFTPVIVYLILPVFYNLKTSSVYEYLELRFGYPTRLCASIAFSVQMILYMGIVLFAPALALEAVTGLNEIFSILIIGFVCTFYSTLGGLKAVLITDIFQSLLMFVSVFSVIICAGIKAKSLDVIWETAREGGRLEFFNTSPDPTTRHSIWTQIFGGAGTYLSMFGVNQAQVQRMLSVRTLKKAQTAVWMQLPILMLLSITTCFSGLCIYYYYRDCDPLEEGRIGSRDQLMPLFVVDTMSHLSGISGLFVAGIFSASLSTISTAISSLAAVTMEDYVKPLVFHLTKKELADSKTILYSKVMTFVYGAVCIGVAFVAKSLGGVLQAALSIFGIVGGPLLGLFTLGMYFKSANQKGAITGLALGLGISFWIGFGEPRPTAPVLSMSTEGCNVATTTLGDFYTMDGFTNVTTSNFHNNDAAIIPFDVKEDDSHYFYLYRLSYMWFSVIGFFLTLIIGLVTSWIYAKLNWDSNAHIYTDAACTQIKYELFVPPIARYMRRKQMPTVVITGTSSATHSTCGDDMSTKFTKTPTNSTNLSDAEGGDEHEQQKHQQQQHEKIARNGIDT